MKTESVEEKRNFYSEFKSWLFGLPTKELDTDVADAISINSVLAMFGNLNEITIYMNKHFNNFNLFNLNKLEFFKFVKFDIINRFNINYYNLSYFYTDKIKFPKELHRFFPYLKSYEIFHLLELIKEDSEYDDIMEYLGLKAIKTEKIKLTKKRKEELEKVEKTTTFNDLRKHFLGE